MRLLSRTIFREILTSSTLGVVLFTAVLFLQRSGPLFEFLVRNSGSGRQVAYLFGLSLPQVLPLTIPLGVLVGTLLTLSRMSSDGEITAMRAGGVPSRRVLPPIVAFCGFMALVAASASLWLTPWSIREGYRIRNQLIASQLTAEVQPRIFAEQFPNSILYVNDVITGPASRWRRIFLADVTPPEERKPGATERTDSPLVTLATQGVAAPDVAQNRIQLSLQNVSVYTVEKDQHYSVEQSPTRDQILQARRNDEVAPTHPVTELDTIPLYRLAYRNAAADKNAKLEARIELHWRLALPLACLLLSVAGIPLGISTRRSGKSSAVVLTLALAFSYFMALNGLTKMAQTSALPPGLALWLPNIVFSTVGVILLTRLEAPGDMDLIGWVLAFLRPLRRVHKEQVPQVFERLRWRGPRVRIMPMVVDTYVLSKFLFYFLVWIVGFVLMYHVFTFFELASDVIRNHISLGTLARYHLFLTPRLIYDLTPYAVLVSVLVVIAVFSKHNEVDAFKACGVSVFRLTAPIFMAGLLITSLLFAFDYYWVPEADRVQNALRAEIKGRPAQTFLRPDRKWIYGQNDRVFYYKYFDQTEVVMGGVNVYEIDTQEFRLKKHIYAERARWEPGLRRWSFQNGWVREMKGDKVTRLDDFTGGIRVFPEVEETPEYFVKEVKQSHEMNFHELQGYIAELKQSGFDTVPLQVQFHKKFSLPLFAFIMVLVSVPFAFMSGNRGNMAGAAISFTILIAYYFLNQVSDQVGNLGQLPAAAAAWSPNAVFSLFGLYFLTRVRT
jgi:LPS export ABC transporter permease LptG/LPS export ABC transporter permease LptF